MFIPKHHSKMDTDLSWVNLALVGDWFISTNTVDFLICGLQFVFLSGDGYLSLLTLAPML